MKIYMLKFGFAGIKNIEKYIELDFYKKAIDKNFDSSDYRVKAVYGENGVGKTAIVTAVSILKNLMLRPNFLADSKNQRLLSELVNKKTEEVKLYAEFHVDFFDQSTQTSLNGKKFDPAVYEYEISLERRFDDQYYISHELLKIKKATYAEAVDKTLAEVNKGELVFLSSKGATGKEIEKRTLNLLQQQTLISALFKITVEYIGSKESNTQIDALLFGAFVLTICALNVSTYLDNDDSHEFYLFREKMKQMLSSNSKIETSWIRDISQQITSYISVQARRIPKNMFAQYRKQINKLTAFIKIFKPSLSSIDIDKKEDGNEYEVNLLFNYKDYSIDLEFESTGIKKLVRIYDALDASASGGISFIDELDANINDVYFNKLIEFMIDYGDGQLCFTTHNVSPMDLLQKKQKGIVFLSQDNSLIPWHSNGNYSPRTQYQKGMIEKIPFNIDATDFLGVLGGE